MELRGFEILIRKKFWPPTFFPDFESIFIAIVPASHSNLWLQITTKYNISKIQNIQAANSRIKISKVSRLKYDVHKSSKNVLTV